MAHWGLNWIKLDFDFSKLILLNKVFRQHIQNFASRGHSRSVCREHWIRWATMPAEVKVCHSHRWVLLTQKLDKIVIAPDRITVYAAVRKFAWKSAAWHHCERYP